MKVARNPEHATRAFVPNDDNETPTNGSIGSSGDGDDVRQLLRATILARKEHGGGDVLPALLARRCCEFYAGLDMDERSNFLTILARDFDVDRTHALAAAQSYIDKSHSLDDDHEGPVSATPRINRHERALRAALRPLYEQFFDQINRLPEGMAFLVGMRGDVLKILQSHPTPPLRHLSTSLLTHLQQTFSTTTLDLRPLTWETTPASILELIAHYEAVHAVPTWQQLKRRLMGPNRLCYAFFHKGMPGVPLTFVMVALVGSVPESVQDILNDPDPNATVPTAGVFYSISSSQKGLSGVDLGNFLIKRVVAELQSRHPTTSGGSQIKTFVTLSPIPRFRIWLETALNHEMTIKGPPPAPLLLESEVVTLGEGADVKMFKTLLEQNHLTPALKPILLRLCARYLLLEKKRAAILDPVANFHIRNGACVQRLNWMGDTSEKGIAQSYGIMVNYNYVLPRLHENNMRYLLDGTVPVIQPVVDDSVKWAVAQATTLVDKTTTTTNNNNNNNGDDHAMAAAQDSRKVAKIALVTVDVDMDAGTRPPQPKL
ncbi:malonyl-CoA decarboxylase-domain-containing protein [Powellomyces hirtus]|nr:malonyl-CoA decarboxylase-domain-containing protein [Powellomyces hirtus]